MRNTVRFSSVFLLLNLIILKVESQNTYDTYNCANDATVNGNDILDHTSYGYTGEYQLFLDAHYWKTSGNFINNAITYKIEAVSFPFTLNCFNCQQLAPTPDRVLRMPADGFSYLPEEKAWVRPVPDDNLWPGVPAINYEYKLRREFSNDFSLGFESYADLASVFIKNNNFVPYPYNPDSGPDQIVYPHTVLKHSFYMHCDGNVASAVVDSFSFVLDHTRGRMRYYPFLDDNSNPGSSSQKWDIGILPSILASDYDGPANYNNSSLIGTQTINYFPLITEGNCINPVPADYSVSYDPLLYSRPPPFSLVQTFISSKGLETNGPAGSGVETGIMHHYIIDQPIDLTIINPSEKIIYNPSEVDIDIPTNLLGRTLTFPTGYVFKTVSGLYPAAAAVYAADPDQLHHYPEDIIAPSTLICDDAGVTTDSYFSYYYVKSGSTLLIEPCVGLYDVKIIVETDGKIICNRSQIYGDHYDIVIESGGQEILSTLSNTANCAHDCYDVGKYDQTDITISANTIWNGTFPATLDLNGDGILRIANTLKINTGNTLRINGALRLEFGENGKIIIEQGAKLIINGTSAANPVVITSADFCKQSMWDGIEVWGDKSQMQVVGSTQGYIRLTNVVLSNARTGIVTQNGNAANVASTSGGIVQCRNVHFTNNYKDVEFLSYHNSVPYATQSNLSFFNNCFFETTNHLNDIRYKTANGRKLAAKAHATLHDVIGVKFYGCTFQNIATKPDGSELPLFDTDLRGTGIYAIDAGLGLYEGVYRNTFLNLSEGVWCLSTGLTRYFSCVGNDFINNVHGLVVEGTKYSAIHKNHFYIPASEYNAGIADEPLKLGYNKPVGLYLIGATDFTAEENIFINFGTASTASPTQPEIFNYGMVVNNCTGSQDGVLGNGTGSVYKNKFSYVNVSLQAELDNKGDVANFAGAGLEYKCNEFIQRINNDVTIVGKLNGNYQTPTYGSIRDQGMCSNNTTTPAGNQFYTSGCNYTEQIATSIGDPAWPLYSAHSSNITYPVCFNDVDVVFPACLTPFIQVTSCPSNFSICTSLPCLYANFNDAQIRAKQILNAYNLLLDGGNTKSLLYQIYANTPPGQLKNSLLGKSPYLSDTVLISYLHPPVATSPGTIKQVLLANSPLTKKVMDAMRTSLPGLPQGIVNQIEQAQTGVSARREKESEVDYYKFRANLSEVKLKQGYLSVDNLDSLKKISEKDTTLQGLFKLMEVLIGKGDYSEAQTCHAKIVSKETPNMSDRCKFNCISLDLAQQGKTWFDMNTSQYNTIKQIYDRNPETAINARAVLALTKGLQYERYPFDVSSDRNHRPVHINATESNQENNGALTNYPNPFNNETIIKATIPKNETDGKLVITDVMGKTIAEYPLLKGINSIAISNADLSNGIYFYYMIVQGVKIKTNKMVRTR